MSVTSVLQDKLFAADSQVYAVLDGAAMPLLLDHLYADRPQFACLLRGELAPDMAEVAPYLVRLEKKHAFTRWLLGNFLGAHWGVIIHSQAGLSALRKHLRSFLTVEGPDGRAVYFRYYDPRVLRLYLPTCNAQESTQVFGPVERYWLENEDADALLCFQPGEVSPLKSEFNLE